MPQTHNTAGLRRGGVLFGLGLLIVLFAGIPILPMNLRAQPNQSNPIILNEVENLKLILISPGSFLIGSKSGQSDEKPVTRVTLTTPFWLGATEVTQKQWQTIMEHNPSSFKAPNLPVECVNFYEALEFCRRVTKLERAAGRLPAGYVYTLPTEAQWEYAWRAGTAGDHPSDLDAMGWNEENSGAKTHEVGGKLANQWGFYDMHGNVWEWCLDIYGDYLVGNLKAPADLISTRNRVVRGGSWRYSAARYRLNNRGQESPRMHTFNIGFRLALSSVR